MSRAHRHYVRGQVWHLTHRCHDGTFLLRDERDRDEWCNWMREACQRYGLCVLDYIVTCNHIHALIEDRGTGEMSRSMQLVAGQVGQRYNRRRSRSGPFWKDRYHATAVESGTHLASCVLYIDMNMVRAGVVEKPSEWDHSGFHEIRGSASRIALIDRKRLSELLGLTSESDLPDAHTAWHGSSLANRARERNEVWSSAFAVGSRSFVREFQHRLGARGLRCEAKAGKDYSALHGRFHKPADDE